MAKKPRKPKTILERQKITVTVIMGGEPVRGGRTVSAEEGQPFTGAWDLHDFDLREWKYNKPETIPILGNHYWDGEKFVDDLHQAKHYHCRDNPDPEALVQSIRQAGYRAAVTCIALRADQMTPAQLRKFLDGIKYDTSNDRLLFMIGSFWEKPITEEEQREWVKYVETHAIAENTSQS